MPSWARSFLAHGKPVAVARNDVLARATASCGRARGHRLLGYEQHEWWVSRNPPTWHIPSLTVVSSETSHTQDQDQGWQGSLVLKPLPPKAHPMATSEVPY